MSNDGVMQLGVWVFFGGLSIAGFIIHPALGFTVLAFEGLALACCAREVQRKEEAKEAAEEESKAR